MSPTPPDLANGRKEAQRLGDTAPWILLIGGAFVYHLQDLTKQSMWPDEVYNLVVSGWSLDQTWRDLVSDHVPLYTLVLGGWRAVAGSSEFGLRYLSVILATLSVSLVVALAYRFLDKPARFLAGVLLAISPFQLYYAQEVVSYSFLGVLVLLASIVFLNWSAHPPWTILLLASGLYAAIAYTHYSGIFFVTTHIAIWLLGSLLQRFAVLAPVRLTLPSMSARWPIAWLVGAAFFAPWFVTHLTFVASGIGGGASKSLVGLLSRALVDVTFGYAVGNHLDLANPVDAQVFSHLTVLAVIVLLCCGLAISPLRRAGRLVTPSGSSVALLHVVVPFGLLLLSVQGAREFSTRYAFPATLWLPILVVAGLWHLRPSLRWLGAIVLTGYSLWGSIVYLDHPGFARLDFRSASTSILEHLQPSDAVIVTAPYVATTFDFYSAARGYGVTGVPLPEKVPSDEAQTRSIVARLASTNGRLWRLRWQDDYADPTGVIPRWLRANAIEESQRDLGGGLLVDLWLTRSPVVSRLPGDAYLVTGHLGDQVRLLGYQLASDWPATMTIVLYWSFDAPLRDDYTVFLHLLDDNGRSIANGDSQPYGGQFRTSRWPTNEIVRDVHEIRVDPCTPGGQYKIATGFYLLQTMQRIGGPNDDAINLTVQLPHIRREPGVGRRLAVLPAALRLDEQLPRGAASGC